MVAPGEGQQAGAPFRVPSPAGTAPGRSYFDGVHVARPAFDPEAFEEQTVRDNEAIFALLQGPGNRHPSNRYPPFYQGNGTYTHVYKPLQGLDDQPSRGSEMEMAPVGHLNGRASRSARKASPYLPQEVMAAFKKLRESLIHEERLNMRDPSYKPLRGLPVPAQNATKGREETTEVEVDSRTARLSNPGGASTSRRNSTVAPNDTSRSSHTLSSATNGRNSETRTTEVGNRSWRVPSPIDTRDWVSSEKRHELRQRRRASIEALVHPGRAPLIATVQPSHVDTTPAPLVDTSRDPRKRRGAE